MDRIAQYNQARWKALAKSDALFTRPELDLTDESAKELVNSDERFGNVSEKRVLCLAGGGGQQSAAFALLGANVTVFDISEEQLERDQAAAGHYDLEIKTVRGDMRDLSAFENDSFDIVHHPYALNFVPDLLDVVTEVSRVLKVGGSYQVNFANPFLMGVRQDDWNGEGYVIKEPYLKNAEITYADQDWVYKGADREKIPQPIEYRHILSDLINGLIESGFVIKKLSDNESISPDLTSEPGTWDHFVAFAPPWLSVLGVYRPDLKF
ncbi:MAG: class I SAM-dependent methyltransferase [Pyrinomonadaceae bacterium]|nr:class I SAM-dependent methyltransferase [Pyrinomonadaceae bacterium]